MAVVILMYFLISMPSPIVSITADKWTTLYIPLSRYNFSYQGVDPTNIKQMIIQLEGAGKVFLDDIKIVPFTKEDYNQMLADVEDMRPKGNPNQLIYPSNFQELAWNIGANDCHSLMEKDKQIHWQWNSCDFYTDGASIGTIGMPLIYEELQIKQLYKSNYLLTFRHLRLYWKITPVKAHR